MKLAAARLDRSAAVSGLDLVGVKYGYIRLIYLGCDSQCTYSVQLQSPPSEMAVGGGLAEADTPAVQRGRGGQRHPLRLPTKTR